MSRMEPGRRCPRCGQPIRWGAVRMVGPRAFCSEACAITHLADESARTAWEVVRLQLAAPRTVRRLQLAWGRAGAWVAQWRLTRRLDAGPRRQILPWLWIPQRPVAFGLALVLVAWGAAGGHVVEPARPPAVPPIAMPPAAPPAGAPLPAELPPGPAPPAGRRVPGPADITRGDRTVREVAFTFDGGDDANVAGEILDALEARGVRATMFLSGRFIRAFPELVRRIASGGHEVGNHLDTHPHLTTYAETRRQDTRAGVTREFLMAELRGAEAAFQYATGRALAPYWRAPYGEHNAEIRGWAAEAGYRHVSWTRGAGRAEDLDTRDWVADASSRSYRSRDEIAARVLAFGRGRPEGLNGGIVLMHLASRRASDRPHTTLPELLQTLQEQGYRLVTVSALVERMAGPAAR